MLLQLKLKNLLLLLSWGLFFVEGTKASLAQIVPDGSTPTTVTTEGNNNVVRDGLVSGENLFHSFSDFSLPDGGEVSFDNAATIDLSGKYAQYEWRRGATCRVHEFHGRTML